jgi:hypothetical protein
MTTALLLPQPAADSLPRGLLIETRYVGATDTKCSRIVAICRRDSDTTFRASVPYEDSHGQLDAHYRAALACLLKIEAQNEYFAFQIQAVGNCAHGYAFITDTHPRSGVGYWA